MMDNEKNAAPEGAEERSKQVARLVGEAAHLLSSARPGEAVERLAEALKLDPYNVPAALNLGGAYIMQGKYDRAVSVLEPASLLEPDNAMLWVNLAAAYLGKPRLAGPQHQERAIRAYERALAADPQAPNVYYNLALIYLERRDNERAAAHFHRALEVNPNDRDAETYLLRLQRGEFEPHEGE
jgi:tetratricopeptide (TPR) repeat protein